MEQLNNTFWTLFGYDYGCFGLNSSEPEGFQQKASETFCVHQCVDPRLTQEKSGNDLEDRLVFCALILKVQACVCLLI